jgi:hypothetical protein
MSKTESDKIGRYDPQELKTLFEAMSIAPGYLSKRFIMRELCGWTEKMINDNASLRLEEEQQAKIGNKLGGFK